MLRTADRRRRPPGGFLLSIAGVSVVEFALCAPIFILLLLGGTDMLRYTIACKRIEAAANALSAMLAQNSSGTVTYKDVQFYHDAAMLIYPDLLAQSFQRNVKWSSLISVSLSSVTFQTAPSCTQDCAYLPSVVWAGGDVPRSCAVPPLPAADADPPSPLTLPAHVFNRGTIVVADVVYQFKPLFQSRLFSNLTIRRSAFVTARLTSLIKYQQVAGDNGIAVACPAYAS